MNLTVKKVYILEMCEDETEALYSLLNAVNDHRLMTTYPSMTAKRRGQLSTVCDRVMAAISDIRHD